MRNCLAIATAVLLVRCASPQANGFLNGLSGSSAAMPESSKQDLLYVSNADNEVTVYDYANQNLIRILTGVAQPEGECTDAAQNVYITDASAKRILEYAHGGARPIKKLNDSPDAPYACSVDPTSGNLAVANDDGSGAGNVAIWTKASGMPARYTNARLGSPQNCAYDSSGALLVASAFNRTSSTTSFAWLPHGGKRLVSISIPGPEQSWKWGFVFGVQWDGRYFVIDDYNLYRISLIRGQAYYVGETSLDDTGPVPVAFYGESSNSQATQVVTGDAGSAGSGKIEYFNYPAGGSPIAEVTHGIDYPSGVAISLRLEH